MEDGEAEGGGIVGGMVIRMWKQVPQMMRFLCRITQAAMSLKPLRGGFNTRNFSTVPHCGFMNNDVGSARLKTPPLLVFPSTH